MLRPPNTLRFCAVIMAFSFAIPAPAFAATTVPQAERSYARLLRSINPHLPQAQSQSFARSVLANAKRTNLDPRLIMALVTVESAWRPSAISHVGARGLGQLMPGTAALLGVNAWDPSQNLRGASRYLRTLINRFAGRGTDTMRFAIGAYNAGPMAVEKYHGIPPYAETQNYVRKVLSMWHTLNGRVGKAFAPATKHVEPVLAADERMWHGTGSALAPDTFSSVTNSTVTAPAVTTTSPNQP